MIFSLIYTVFAIAVTVFLIKKIKNIPVEIVEKPDGTTRKKYKPHQLLAALLAGVITAYLLVLIPIVFMADLFIEDYWLFFGKKRIAYIESRFSMTVDDDIKLKKFQRNGGREGTYSWLEFECEMNGSEFFASKLDGTLYQYEEDGVCYVFDPDTNDYEVSEYSISDRDEYWFRTSGGKKINATFIPKEDGSGYKVRLD